MNFPTISLCMIVKNEAEFLSQAISSVRSIVDEIIIVDTGSTDNTIQIAESFGARVIKEQWQDDFSKHRNTSLENATSDWILVLDADEAIDKEQLELIRKYTLSKNSCYLLAQRHYTDDHRLSGFIPCSKEYPEWEREHIGYFESSLCRLFPNDSAIRYRGAVHELVEHSISECSNYKLVQSKIRLHHYGNTAKIKRAKEKSKLYTPLGEKKVNQEPTTWKGYYELGVEHNCNGRLQESKQALTRASELNNSYIPTWINLGYVLIELEELNEAFVALSKALELDPSNYEAHCNMGVLYMRRRDYIFAIEHLKRAIKQKPDYINGYSNLGISLMKIGRIEEGTKIFEAGYNLAPNNGQLLAQFGYALYQAGIYQESLTVLKAAIAIIPKEPSVWLAQREVYQALGMTEKARESTEIYNQLTTNREQG